MLNPSIDNLLNCVDSKYSLVVGAAKRARELGAESKKNEAKLLKSNKFVGIALDEIYQGKIIITPFEEQ